MLSFTPLKYTMGVGHINGYFSLGLRINLKLININTRCSFLLFFPLNPHIFTYIFALQPAPKAVDAFRDRDAFLCYAC